MTAASPATPVTAMRTDSKESSASSQPQSGSEKSDKVPRRSWKCPPRFIASDNEVEGNIYMHNPKALPIRVINWYQVFETYYLKHTFVCLVAAAVYFAPFELTLLSDLAYRTVETFGWSRVLLTVLLPLFFYWYRGPHWRSSVYLIDFETHDCPESWKMTIAETKEIINAQPDFNTQSKEFMSRILNTSGIGHRTAWPPSLMRVIRDEMADDLGGVDSTTTKGGGGLPDGAAAAPSVSLSSRSTSTTSELELKEVTVAGETPCSRRTAESSRSYQPRMSYAREETEAIVFSLVENLLKKTKKKPKDIDFLVVNCSLFCPTPSICAMIANKFKFREDICSYNLGGMGCSAGVISIDLAKQLIQNRPGATAMVVSTENLSQNLYTGNNRSMMMQNTLFRCGGAAILLSSKSYNAGTKRFAKYKLLHSGRTFMSDDESFKCIWQEEDINTPNACKGVRLDRNIVTVAGRALTKQFTQLGPHILPITEQVKTLFSIFCDKLCKNYLHFLAPKYFPPRYKIYTPDFKKCIDHFCIHAGGRAVIEGVQKNLRLSDRDVEPSFETLKNYGNTSSSSIWYELQYIEQKKYVESGHQVLQIAFGSGFKCNSAVWLRL
eukprot:CAMPEP_0178992314 /NCGR_PEP_ID=MMETSP0795-20121207/6041_1 /TAXON_ID=88552 /ORGANISM="Amoebophrya sp., Strain Ameob2" /LENGTH=607 /DNA_ID=CAMNT_0020684173 /DNA_START=198 /DNA_END=2021 /DNA_ORIENTATION=-